MHDLLRTIALLGRLAAFFSVAGALTCGGAQAIPSYAGQTGQPCSACHVGAFGPALRQQGRDFKLYGYAMWDDWLYLELTGYRGLGRDVRSAFNVPAVTGGGRLSGVVPYWRAALQHEFAEGQHYIQLGTYGLAASVSPGTGGLTGLTDHYLDIGFDTTYEWIADVADTTSPVLFVHASVLRENADLNASRIAALTNARDRLTVARAEISYAFGATFTPTLQYFHIDGTADAARWSTAAGSPGSAGWAAELAYVPWGKPSSEQQFFNLRLMSRYTAYSRFNGMRSGAGDHDNLFLGATLIVGLNH